MTTVNTDVDTITSESETITLSSGLQIEVQRLKTRQLMALLKILTRGVSGSIGSLLFNQDDSEEGFTAALLGSAIIAIPEAQDETIDFLKAMTTPAELVDSPRTKQDKEKNETLWGDWASEMENPEIEDLFSLVERIVRNEAPHIQALGKRLALLLNLQTSSATAKQSSSSKSGSKN